jgi:hypothetical protein
MAVIGSESAIVQRHFDVLLNAAAVFEAKPKIICAVRMAVLGRAPIVVCRKPLILVNPGATL